MSALEEITHFEVPIRIVDQTLAPLQEAGKSGYEAFVLWGGRRTEDSTKLVIEASYFPRQTTMATEDGLLVVVEGEALFRVNRVFHEHGLILAAQVHSHPTEAFHSSTDDAYPLVTLLGGLSGWSPTSPAPVAKASANGSGIDSPARANGRGSTSRRRSSSPHESPAFHRPRPRLNRLSLGISGPLRDRQPP